MKNLLLSLPLVLLVSCGTLDSFLKTSTTVAPDGTVVVEESPTESILWQMLALGLGAAGLGAAAGPLTSGVKGAVNKVRVDRATKPE